MKKNSKKLTPIPYEAEYLNYIWHFVYHLFLFLDWSDPHVFFCTSEWLADDWEEQVTLSLHKCTLAVVALLLTVFRKEERLNKTW